MKDCDKSQKQVLHAQSDSCIFSQSLIIYTYIYLLQVTLQLLGREDRLVSMGAGRQGPPEVSKCSFVPP